LLASLRSRNSGLNAKVTEQETLIKSLREELGTARAGLTDKESADADLRAQLDAAFKERDQLQRQIEVATLSAKYPEAFAELGDSIFGMAPERLASIEARLAGAKDAGEELPETSRPVGNNPQRGASGSKNEDDDTVSASGEAPVAVAEAPAAAAAPSDDLLASLRSRNSGLNAKVGEQEALIKSLREELGTARAGLTDKESADADLRAQLKAALEEKEQLQRQFEVTTLASKYPEAYAELGESIFGMAPERLASIAARLAGAKDSGEEQETTTRPVGNNPQRGTSGSKNIEDMTVDELRQSLRDMPRDAFGLSS
jgi:chromosome segregation ATPase